MTSHATFCPAGQWTKIQDGPNFGFVYVTNVMDVPITFRWRAYYASLWFYSDGSATINPGQQQTIFFGTPSVYDEFQVNPPFNAELWGH